MEFRARAFGIHLLASAATLAGVLGILWAGWYRWPGWRLTGALHLAAIMVGVDVALGPLLTLIVADPGKPRRELRRDIAMIVTMQLLALGYGTTTLWRGRPLYYAFSVDMIQLVQAADLDPAQVREADRARLPLAPHWDNRPRWVWAPLPADPKLAARIESAAISGGYDVISMPTYFKPWQQGLATLHGQLRTVGQERFFSVAQIAALERRMRERRLPTRIANSIALTGRGPPMLAVFDPATLRLLAVLSAT